MKLTFEQIKSITVGSVCTEQREDGIHFAKCTSKQIEAWHAKSEGLGKNCACTTGVRLDFHTNSQNVSFYVVQGGKYEIFVDGLFRKQFAVSEEGVVSYSLCGPLGDRQEEYRVTVLLPSHGKPGIIKDFTLDDGAYLRPHDFDRKILFIGDSITQGWASDVDGYSYAYRVSSFFNANSVIQGTGGAFFHESCFDSIDFDPDVVIVAYGTNDFGHYKTYEDLRASVEAHVALLASEYSGKKLFAISPIWRERRDGKAMGSFEGCRDIIIEIVKKYGFTHIDGLNLVPPRPELFKDEYLHPNDLGFSFYSENLIKELVNKI